MQNLKTIRSLACFATLMLVVLMSGCSENVVVKRMKPAPPAVDELKPVEDLTDALAQFDPPFPEQVLLFEPVKIKRPQVGKPIVHNESAPVVELVGFGSVGAAHALLMIDGRMEALRVGQRYGNVHVLQIEPPRVKLRVAGQVREKTLLPDQDER